MIVKDWLTEKDGVSFCPVRIAFFIAMVVYTCGVVGDWIHATEFVFSSHAKDVATGYGQILGWGGGAVAGKNYTEEPS